MGRKYDLTSKNDYMEVMEHFGGEEYLKEKFPLMYKAFQDSASVKSEKKNEDTVQGKTDLFSVDFFETQCTDALGTDAKIQKGVIMQSKFYYIKQRPVVIVESRVSDENGKLYGCNTYVFEECFGDSIEEQLQEIYLNKEYKLHGESVYTSFVKEGEKIIVMDCKTEEGNSEIYLGSGENLIKEIKLSDPVNKHKKKSAQTFILYGNRNAADVSYQYKDVPNPTEISGKKYVNIWCPFKISVELEKYKFHEGQPLSDTDFSLKLESSNPEEYGGGGVAFNNVKDIKTTLSKNNTLLEIEIPLDWKVKMTVNDINLVIGSFNFRAVFKINYELEVGTEKIVKMASVMAATEVIATASGIYVEPIKIQWGCFGKESVLKTESGKKSVAEIKTGDRILSREGTYVMVTNVSTGFEKDIISFQTEGCDDILQLTAAHGVQTKRGIIPACDLLVEDEVLTEDGSYQELVYLAIDSYNDEVYNIETEGHAMFVASGIVVTDSECLVKVNPVNKTETKLPEEFLEELRLWAKERNKNEKG